MNDLPPDREVTMTCRQCHQPVTQLLSEFQVPNSRCPHCKALLRSKRLTVPVKIVETISDLLKRVSPK